MQATPVTDSIYRLFVTVAEGILFESMWPLSTGMTMNSYLVKGRQAALIDGVCGWDGVPQTLHRQLEELSTSVNDIRYVVLNHLEPDHTRWLSPFREITPDFEIVATPKGVEMVREFFGITSNLKPVTSGEKISLGGGRELVFEEIPHVHWPETLVTYEAGTGTLFSGDAFGSFGYTGDSPYDDQLTEEDLSIFEYEALRYYANVIAAFSGFVHKALDKPEGLDIRTVASAHGVVWRKDPHRIIELYRRFARNMTDPGPEITLVWGSMYGNTERAVRYAVEGARSENVNVHVHRVPQEHVSYILASAWRSKGLIPGAPTYEYKMFPPLAHVIDDFSRKKVMKRLVGRHPDRAQKARRPAAVGPPGPGRVQGRSRGTGAGAGQTALQGAGVAGEGSRRAQDGILSRLPCGYSKSSRSNSCSSPPGLVANSWRANFALGPWK